MKLPGLRAWGAVSLPGVTLLCWGMHRQTGGAGLTPEFAAALGLLLFNQGMFLWAEQLDAAGNSPLGSLWGLAWIVIKLFVNTFTIFLLIGLHAIQTPVFVPLFFPVYAVVLFVGIFRLNLVNLRHHGGP